MKKMFKTLALIGAVSMLSVGCGNSSNGEVESNIEKAEDIIEEVLDEIEEIIDNDLDGDFISIVDQADRTVIIPEDVDKIVSCYYTATSSLIAIDAHDKLVGIEIGAENRPIYVSSAPELIDLPSVGSGQSFNMEEALALDPDVVIMPTRLMEYIPTLEDAGIAVVVVSPESNEELLEMFDLLGVVSGEEENASELISFYADKLDEIKALDLVPAKNVYLSSNSNYLATTTSNMYQHYLIETASGINVAGDLDDSYWANISAEQLLNYNPDIWLVPSGASYNFAEIFTDSAIQDINAIKNGAVYTIPSTLEGWDYPNPSSILGVLWTTYILQPEVYTKDMISNSIVEFYDEFYDIDVNPDELLTGLTKEELANLAS